MKHVNSGNSAGGKGGDKIKWYIVYSQSGQIDQLEI